MLDPRPKFAGRSQAPRLPILLWVGSKGFNYEYNLKYSAYLRKLGLDHQLLVVPDAPTAPGSFTKSRAWN